ncbi:hypothetical protein [Aeromicrobium piscarium]|uniref:Asp23/Gls24 family envelope stress response protein n=1 Tax=Aeromicrobium piscarium TaxID=2590901 RepID=A0A554SQ32_9ACTN|nr:hypothetical protein [Aeromicrobium piscarium]TSD68369.1 hypothetical protein FNM00_01890 [Aeromicrobium piscarium]
MNPGDQTSAAIRAAREEPTPEGWFTLSDDIMRRVRRIVRPSAPMIAFSADGSPAHGPRFSRVLVAGRVLIAVLRRHMERSALRPEGVELEVVDDRLVAVILTITGRYGDELLETADRARQETLSCVKEMLGDDPDFTASSIEVVVSDIVEPG